MCPMTTSPAATTLRTLIETLLDVSRGEVPTKVSCSSDADGGCRMPQAVAASAADALRRGPSTQTTSRSTVHLSVARLVQGIAPQFLGAWPHAPPTSLSNTLPGLEGRLGVHLPIRAAL